MSLLVTSFLLLGQNKPVINYTTHNGLPQIQVRAVFQDSRGYIWAGTKSGLVCYNGIKFTSFLPNKSIEEIKEYANGDIIIKTLNRLYRYDGNSMHQIFESIQPFAFILAQNDVWISCSPGLLQYKKDTLFQAFLPGRDLPEGGIISFAYDSKINTMYFVDISGKNIYKYIGKSFQKIITAPEDTKLFIDKFNNGEVGMLEYHKTYFSVQNMETKDEYYRCFFHQNNIDSILVNHIPTAYHIYGNNYNYFKIDSATCSATKIELNTIKAPFPVIFDKDMNIWAGSDNGLYHIINSPFKVYDRSFMNDFWTIIKGKDGRFYGAVFKKGLYKLDFEKQQKQEIIAYRKNNIKETDYYYGASKDKQGNLYFPTHFGIIKYNYLKTKKFDTGISLISKYDPFSDRIIIGQENGIAFIDKNENIEYCIDSTAEILVSHPVSIEFPNDSTIWVGTGKSISKFNRATKKFSHLIPEKSLGPKNGVIAMTKDHLDNIWLGGRDGLWLYRTETKIFERIDKNLIESNIAALNTPNPNLLIIGTSREIFVLNLNKFYSSGELEMKLYNYNNGFVAEEVCQNGFLLNGNQLIIPSTTVTSVMDLAKVQFVTEFNDVRITKVNGEGIPFKTKNNEPYKIKKGINEVEFNFETVGFGLPTTPQFRYKLEGMDNDWKEWTTSTFAHYANLPSGEYTFRVISKTGNSISTSQNKTDFITTKITLPFYKEPNLYKYAFFIFALLSSVIIYFGWSGFRYKIKVSEREQKIKFLEIATLQAQLSPHFIFNFLSSVQSLISAKKPEEANSYLVKFSRLMRAFMESSIKSSKVLAGLSATNEITIAEEIDLLKMYIDLDAMKHEKGKINYEILVAENQLLNKSIPPMIIQPLVENAIKHGILPKDGPGHIKIHFSNGDDYIVCTIEDDGIGFEEAQSLRSQTIKLHHSRGIEIINKKIEILNELGYSIHIKYLPVKKGTTVTIHFSI
ncbi:MAG TPA: histidine kinase [Draconibacterium sp.]|nr:histidine kinase [Draconibacterium sp.]